MFDRFMQDGLAGRPFLHNHYTLMRHGRAGSNLEAVLAATHDPRFGLMEEGRETVIRAAAHMSPLPFVIIASDTPRGAQTGEIMRDNLPAHPALRLDWRLRERFWGDHEGTAEHNCFAVYGHDKHDLTSHPDNAETVASMVERLSSLIVDLEAEFKDREILLVSHCDPIQVLQVIFSGQSVGHYIEMPEFKCAEFRPIAFSPRKTAAEAAGRSILLKAAGTRGDACQLAPEA